jgi:Flp pilus assembly protein TadG
VRTPPWLTNLHPNRAGKGMAEFVIAFPVFLIVLVAVIDLGMNFGDGIQLSQGTSEAVQLAARSDVGHRDHCDIATNLPLATLSNHAICLIKFKTHLDPAGVRVRIFYETNDGQPTADYQPVTAGEAGGATMVVCVMSPEKSATGLLSAVFDRRVHHDRVTTRLEVPVKAAAGSYPPAASERPLTGQNWSFCTADDPNATT